MRLFDALDRNSAYPALVDASGVVITHGELAVLADDIVAGLESRRLVLFLCSNTIDSVKLYVGLMRAGHVCVMLASTIEKNRLFELQERFGPNLLVAPLERIGDLGLRVDKHVGDYGFVSLSMDRVDMNEDLALLMTTSGSTGSPMLVRVSSANLISNAASIIGSLDLTSTDRALTTLPMNYTYGLSIINSQLQCGGSLAVSNASLMDRQFWTMVSGCGATYFGGVPYTYQVLERIGMKRLYGSTLRMLTQAGGKLDEEAVLRIHQTCMSMGIEFNVMYGQTEATARMTVLKSQDLPLHPWSIGRPIPGGVVRVVDPDTGDVMPAGATGELEYQGPNVTMGYATSAIDLTRGDELHGLLRTGDLGTVDQDGFLRIVGRRKRFVKVFGNRVNLDDIERYLLARGTENACTGVDDLITVHVVGSSDKDLGLLQELVAAYISVHKTAVAIRPVGELPRAESGKVLYSRLMGVDDGS